MQSRSETKMTNTQNRAEKNGEHKTETETKIKKIMTHKENNKKGKQQNG